MKCERCGGRTRKSKGKKGDLCASCSTQKKSSENLEIVEIKNEIPLRKSETKKTLPIRKTRNTNEKTKRKKRTTKIKTTVKSNTTIEFNNQNNKVDWESLPSELWYHILRFLPISAIFSFSQVSKRFEEVSNYPPIWIQSKDIYLISIKHHFHSSTAKDKTNELIDIHNNKVESMYEKHKWKELYCSLSNNCIFCNNWAGLNEKQLVCVKCKPKFISWSEIILEVRENQSFLSRELIHSNDALEIYDSLIQRFGDIHLYKKYSTILRNIVKRTNIYYFPLDKLETLLPNQLDYVNTFRKIFFNENLLIKKRISSAIDFINSHRHYLYENAIQKSPFSPFINRMIEVEISDRKSLCYEAFQRFKQCHHIPADELIFSLFEALLETITPKEAVDQLILFIKDHWIKGTSFTMNSFNGTQLENINFLPFLLPECQLFLVNSLHLNDPLDDDINNDEGDNNDININEDSDLNEKKKSEEEIEEEVFDFGLLNQDKLRNEVLLAKILRSRYSTEMAFRLTNPPWNFELEKYLNPLVLDKLKSESAVRLALAQKEKNDKKKKKSTPKFTYSYKLPNYRQSFTRRGI